jgi:hypothetical protein
MTAIEVACPICASQPGELCIWLEFEFPKPNRFEFHDERSAITAMESGAADQDTPTSADFNQAVEGSGLV